MHKQSENLVQCQGLEKVWGSYKPFQDSLFLNDLVWIQNYMITSIKTASTLLTRERHFTQGHSGSTGIGVGQKESQERTTMSRVGISPSCRSPPASQGEMTSIHVKLPCQTQRQIGWGSWHIDTKWCAHKLSHFCSRQFHKVTSTKNGVFFFL